MSKPQNKTGLKLTETYLILYNVILAIGWLIILFVTHQTMLTWKTNDDLMRSKNLYKNVEFFLQIFQTAALLEVVHAAVGLVRSNAILVFLQVLSRILVVWLVMCVFETSRSSIGVLICCLAWSVAEIVRYIYYALNILEKIPYFLTWCRYSFFLFLYPIGITGELVCIYQAVKYLEPLKIRNKYSLNLPNVFNISFDLYYFLIFTMILYIPIFPQLYGHMLKQRSKILGSDFKKDKKKV